jgi:hypothetical protein
LVLVELHAAAHKGMALLGQIAFLNPLLQLVAVLVQELVMLLLVVLVVVVELMVLVILVALVHLIKVLLVVVV